MIRGAPLFVLLLHGIALVPACMAQSPDVPRDVLQLARVRAHMSDLLTRLPNYTCLLNIERSRRGASGRTELTDVVRLEVALVNGDELFAWPGSKKFQDTRIIDMVKGGAIGSGNFALHAKSVFQSSAPKFTFAGERTTSEGRQTLRWDYVVPVAGSGYMLRSPPNEAVVGYHGSIWVDAKTMDAVRLEVHADDIPKPLGIQAADDAIEYQRASLGAEEFLLPSRAELRLTSASGMQSINRTTFTGCRQYAGESTISFEDTKATAESERPPERTLTLNAGINLRVDLETPLSDGVSAVGDPVTAILKKDVKLGAGLVAPKGAFLHGRIVTLRRQNGYPVDWDVQRQGARPHAGWVVAFHFSELEWENTRALLAADLVATPALQAIANYGSQALRTAISQASREQGAFFVAGQRLSVLRGFPMEWRTRAVEEEDKR